MHGGDNNSKEMLVEEEVDQVNCHVENRHGLPCVPPLDSNVYSCKIAGGDSKSGDCEDDAWGSVGVITWEASGHQIGSAYLWLLLAPCGRCGKHVGGAYRCSGCGAHTCSVELR